MQRVVRVNSKENLIATAGTDGHIRLWDFPSLKLKLDIRAHKEDILDLDFDPTSTQVKIIALMFHVLLPIKFVPLLKMYSH